MISIIIPVYNVEEYLPYCLDSVLNQTYTDFEVILVNDGSVDSSGQICNDYSKKDSRIRVIHQENSGVSAARNIGINEAKGEWISFIDSDDFVDVDYLEAFEVEDNDVDLVVQGREYFDHRSNQYFDKKQFKKVRLTLENTIRETTDCKLLEIGFPTGKLYRRTLLIANNIQFDTSISFHEDHIFVLEYLNVAENVVLSDSIAYKYRCYHSRQSLSSKRHPWQNLSHSADGMIISLNALRNKYFLSGSATEMSAYNFAYSPKISAVNELFRTKESYNVIRSNYRSIINTNELRDLYNPNDNIGKFYRWVLLYLPFPCIYLIFKTLVKYQNRKK